jgi:hypothetical protein
MAEENQVISCHTVEDWTEQFEKGKESKKLVFNYIYIFFCVHCFIFTFFFFSKFDQPGLSKVGTWE